MGVLLGTNQTAPEIATLDAEVNKKMSRNYVRMSKLLFTVMLTSVLYTQFSYSNAQSSQSVGVGESQNRGTILDSPAESANDGIILNIRTVIISKQCIRIEYAVQNARNIPIELVEFGNEVSIIEGIELWSSRGDQLVFFQLDRVDHKTRFPRRADFRIPPGVEIKQLVRFCINDKGTDSPHSPISAYKRSWGNGALPTEIKVTEMPQGDWNARLVTRVRRKDALTEELRVTSVISNNMARANWE